LIEFDCEPEPWAYEAEADPEANGDEKFAPAATFIASFLVLISVAVKVLESLVLWSRPPSWTEPAKT
jgi:hypothetical protein